MACSAVDIWLSAQALVEEYETAAPGVALMEADALSEAGDWYGQATWRHIARAAEMLLAARASEKQESKTPALTPGTMPAAADSSGNHPRTDHPYLPRR